MSQRIEKMGAQGDVLFVRVEAIPEGAVRQPEAEEYVVAHSETGHHHVARKHGRDVSLYHTGDPCVSYLEFRGGPQPIEHLRSFHTHETVELLERADATLDKIDEALSDAEPARFMIIRQRQLTPEGWQRVVD